MAGKHDSSHDNYRAFDHKAWAEAGLKDFSEYADKVTYINQSEYGDGQLEGEWFYADDATRTIYSGTFGNYNSPGASSYTYADVYGDEEAYRFAVSVFESNPEWYDEDDDEDEDDCDGGGGDDEEEEDKQNEPCDGDLVTTDWVEYTVYMEGGGGKAGGFRVPAGERLSYVYSQWCEAEQFWPSLWFLNERGTLDLIDIETERFVV